MFNLIAQYIGYGTESSPDSNGRQDPKFGIVEEGDWTVVDVANIEDVVSRRSNNAEDDYQCVDTPENLNNLDWSMSESVDGRLRDIPVADRAVMPAAERRIRCPKAKKNQRVTASYMSRQRPNQMKRCNQVFCMRNSKANQKMRQIVHQPRKF